MWSTVRMWTLITKILSDLCMHKSQKNCRHKRSSYQSCVEPEVIGFREDLNHTVTSHCEEVYKSIQYFKFLHLSGPQFIWSTVRMWTLITKILSDLCTDPIKMVDKTRVSYQSCVEPEVAYLQIQKRCTVIIDTPKECVKEIPLVTVRVKGSTKIHDSKFFHVE